MIQLPSNFKSLASVDDQTAVIVLDCPREPVEGKTYLRIVKAYRIVDKDTFETIHELPRIPGSWCSPTNVNGLGHVFNITGYPLNFYYIPEDAYKWLGGPPTGARGKRDWPQLPGFVFIGGQEIKSEGSVYLYVDNAGSSQPQLSIHEQDTNNLSWVRWGAWRGKRRMMSGGNEDYMVRRRHRKRGLTGRIIFSPMRTSSSAQSMPLSSSASATAARLSTAVRCPDTLPIIVSAAPRTRTCTSVLMTSYVASSSLFPLLQL